MKKYQGGERGIITNLWRLLVAISRSRLLTVVVCSTALFEVASDDSERLDDGPVWAPVHPGCGRDAEPAWAGPLAEFTGEKPNENAGVPVRVYPSAIDIERGEQ